MDEYFRSTEHRKENPFPSALDLWFLLKLCLLFEPRTQAPTIYTRFTWHLIHWYTAVPHTSYTLLQDRRKWRLLPYHEEFLSNSNVLCCCQKLRISLCYRAIIIHSICKNNNVYFRVLLFLPINDFMAEMRTILTRMTTSLALSVSPLDIPMPLITFSMETIAASKHYEVVLYTLKTDILLTL